MAGADSVWLKSTLSAVRELMLQRLGKSPVDPEMERDVQMALEELEVMWEELQGQTELLQRESERYHEFFESSPDAYVISDAGGNIREANGAAADFLAATKAEMLGKPLSGFIAADQRTHFVAKFVSLVTDSGVKSLTWQSTIQPRRGAPAAATLSVRAIPLRKSGVAGLCWLIRPA